jgi:MEMO1 family protein
MMLLKGAFIVPHPPLILPEVGGGRQKTVQRTIDAYEKAARQIKSLAPDTLVIATPHAMGYSEYFTVSSGEGSRGSFGDFGAPEVELEVLHDQALSQRISFLAEAQGLSVRRAKDSCDTLDHGTMIPLYFLRAQGLEIPIVRISISGLSPEDHRSLGRCVTRAARELGRSFVFIASGDLSHKLKEEGPYGYAAEGPVFDRCIREAVENCEFSRFFEFEEKFCRRAAECGLRTFQMLAGVMEGMEVQSELLSYEAPFGVGYMVAAFKPSETGQDAYVRLARQSLEHTVGNGSNLDKPEGLPGEFSSRKGGVFVSLKIDGRLRGCIGTIQPVYDTLAEEIIHNAVSAGLRDPRFPPVRKEELPLLSYSVDVLTLPEPIESSGELDPKRYGVIVSFQGRRGLLLPDLEGVDTVEQQLRIALQKAGIDENQPYRMQRFEVLRHTESRTEEE